MFRGMEYVHSSLPPSTDDAEDILLLRFSYFSLAYIAHLTLFFHAAFSTLAELIIGPQILYWQYEVQSTSYTCSDG